MKKKWYMSKGVWLGVATFSIGAIEIIRSIIEAGDFSVLALLTAVAGIFKVAERVARGTEEVA